MVKFCEELRALHGTSALLQGLDRSGLLFKLNGMTFEVVETPNSNGHSIVAEIRLHSDQTVTIHQAKMTSGVRVVLNTDHFMLLDLWVDHVHLRCLERHTRAQDHIEVKFLDPNRSWPKRSSSESSDYLGTREYDMLVGELAGKLKEQMRQEAAIRIKEKKLLAAAEREAFAQLVKRDDLGEDNPNWGEW